MLLRCVFNLPRTFIRNFTATAPSMCQATPVAETVVAEPDTTEPEGTREVLPNVEGLTEVNLEAEPATPLVDETAGERQQQIDDQSHTNSYTFNLVHLVGRVGCDPVVRGTDMRKIVCFSLATNKYMRDESSTEWHNIAATSTNLASYIKNNVNRGDLVSVTGTLNYRKLNIDSINPRGTLFPQIRAERIDILMRKRPTVYDRNSKNYDW